MTNKKIVKIIIILLTIVVLGTAGAAYAYFTDIRKSSNIDIGIVGDTASKREIRHQNDLIKYGTDNYFVPDKNTSDSGQSRFTLVFYNDIVLNADIYLNADIAIDLNGFNLILNGYTLTVSHSYYGVFSLYSSVADSNIISTGADGYGIIISVPFADAIFDNQNVAYYIDESEAFNSIVYLLCSKGHEVNAQDSIYFAYESFYNTALSIAHQTAILKPRFNYNDVMDYAEGQEEVVFGTDMFLLPVAAGENQSSRVFIINKDLDLPLGMYSRLGFGLSFSSSSVTGYGKVTLPAIYSDEVLLATFAVGDTHIAMANFDIRILNVQDSSATHYAAKLFMDEYLGQYFDEDEQKYLLDTYVFLPISISGYNFTYSYEVTDSEGEIVGNVLETDLANGGIVLMPNQNTTRLKVIISGGTQHTQIYEIESDVSARQENIHTVSTDIITLYYGDRIIVYKDNVSIDAYNGYSTRRLLTEIPEDYQNMIIDGITYQVLDITYSLINDINSIYSLYIKDGDNGNLFEHDTLYVNTGKNPEDATHLILLSAVVEIKVGEGNPQFVEVLLPIILEDSGSGESTVSGFLPYYFYFNDLLNARTKGYVYSAFEMPFIYRGGNVAIVFDDIDPRFNDILIFTLSYQTSEGTVNHVLTLSEGITSYREALDAYLSSESWSLSEFIENYPEAKWVIGINYDNLGRANSTVTFTYYYKFSIDFDKDWKTEYPEPDEEEPEGEEPEENEGIPVYQISFVLAGIIKNQTNSGGQIEHIEDETLYKVLYDILTPYGDVYAVGQGKYILSDWIAKPLMLDNTLPGQTLLNDVTNFRGITLLSGISKITLKNSAAVTENNLIELLKLSRLTELVISENSLSDRGTGPKTIPLSIFAASRLEILDISGNNFYEFAQLNAMPSLRILRNYNNINLGIDSIFYGSNGVMSVVTYNDMLERGIKIYNILSSGTQLEFERTKAANDFIQLTSIEYQQQLKTGLSIELIYASLSTNHKDFALSTQYQYTSSSGQIRTAVVTAPVISYKFQGDANTTDAFYLEYSCLIDGQSAMLTIKFGVTRI